MNMDAVEVREFLNLVRWVVYVIAADLTEKDLPLAEEGLGLGIGRAHDRIIERADAGLSKRSI